MQLFSSETAWLNRKVGKQIFVFRIMYAVSGRQENCICHPWSRNLSHTLLKCRQPTNSAVNLSLFSHDGIVNSWVSECECAPKDTHSNATTKTCLKWKRKGVLTCQEWATRKVMELNSMVGAVPLSLRAFSPDLIVSVQHNLNLIVNLLHQLAYLLINLITF